jgi:hypothetical protein
MPTKPIVTGPIDGNIFSVLGATKKALQKAGKSVEASTCQERVFKAESYDNALAICCEYVEFDLDS